MSRRPGMIERIKHAATKKANQVDCLKSTNLALKQRLENAISEQKRTKRLVLSS